MRWETVFYVTVSLIVVTVSHLGSSRMARLGAWLLLMSCIYCNVTWCQEWIKNSDTGIQQLWSYPDAAMAGLFTALYLIPDKRDTWKLVVALVSWTQLFGNAAYMASVTEPTWVTIWLFAAVMNLGFWITAIAIMSPTLQIWRNGRDKRSLHLNMHSRRRV